MRYKPFFLGMISRFQKSREINQPVPLVREEDVIRVVQREFPKEQFESVISVLNEYGTEKWEGGQPRVRVAALKLANGNLDRLKRAIENAKCDYRDVLAAAEYPQYSREWGVLGLKQMSEKEKRRIFSEDSAQYESWLRR